MHDDASPATSISPLLAETVSTPEAIVRVLEQAGVRFVFGMPGGNTGLVFNALYDHPSTIRTVLVRDEVLAGIMAEVCGRLTGVPAVAMGQAAFLVNASRGAIEGLLSGSPMLLLTDLSENPPFTHHAPYQAASGEYGNWDARQAFAGFTKQAVVASNGAHAVQATQLAIKHATSGQPGPIALLYRLPALRETVGPDTVPTLYASGPLITSPVPHPAPAELARAAELLAHAARPLVIAGNGIRLGRAYAELAALAEHLGAAVATSAAGKSVLPETHPQSLGVYGSFGTPVANAMVSEADVILVAGSKLGATDTAFENPELIDPTRQRLIQIDIEPCNTSWTYPCEVSLVGDLRTVLGELRARLEGRVSDEARGAGRARIEAARQRHGFFNAPEMLSDDVPVLPQRIIRALHEAIGTDAIITCDAGENRLHMTHYFQSKAPGSLIQPAGVGAMGYAIPAALAAKLVHPDRPAIAVCGDGGFGIGLNGLMTAVEERIPIVVLVFNNQALGWVRNGQGERPIASEFAPFDHAAIARAMGCDGQRVERPVDVRPAIEAAIASGRPTVIDVRSALTETFRKVTSPLVRKP
ncbi:MAG: thiamine pyrophosphate-binding protein [Ectothiorhodospiraceae bacterium]|nr:thiamine pyrophosphate-binding protein [Ectothiorhodospiraceae bacterium]